MIKNEKINKIHNKIPKKINMGGFLSVVLEEKRKMAPFSCFNGVRKYTSR
jgi:hypothetical protein